LRRYRGKPEKQKEDRIASMVNTGFDPATSLRNPSSTKSRSIQKVKADMMRFYMDPAEALIDTIYEANEAYHTRKFVGTPNRKAAIDSLNRFYKNLDAAKTEAGKAKWQAKVDEQLKKVASLDKVSDESISALIMKEAPNLSEQAEGQLLMALRARLNAKGMTGGTAVLRNAGLIYALGSPINAITQLGDLVWSFFENGPVNTVRAIFGTKEVTTDDLDMTHVLKEFAQGSTAKWLDKTLKWTGFAFMDQFGKNVNMQAAINKARSSSKEGFIQKWSKRLTPETAEKVWNDMQEGKVTDDVRHFVFQSVAKWQPVSLSEMPPMYLKSGNGRIFYTLKSYGIKTLSNLRREIIGNFQKGDTKAGVKGLTTLLPLLVLANASVDELKDWILGREDAFSDKVWDNLLTIGFASRYTVDRGFRSGSPVMTFFKDVLVPPGLGVADPIITDFANLVTSDDKTLKSISVIPVVGKIAYNFSPEGQEKELDRRKKDIYDAIRASVSEGGYNDVRQRINRYNREIRKSGGDIISNKTIRSIKSKERKKLREGGK